MIKNDSTVLPATLSATLYLIGTPIGNLGDLSPRAIKILQSSDLILAEDTRHSIHLLKNFGITTPLKSYHQHNEMHCAEKAIELLKSGKNIALVTDAGMPTISDPGHILVKQAYEENIVVTVVPGPCAVSSAIAISGIDCHKYYFEGFLSSKAKARCDSLEKLKSQAYASVIYEAPHRLLDCVSDIVTIFGAEHQIAVIKEITKKYEKVFYGQAKDVYNQLHDGTENPKIKGEYVIVISKFEQSGAIRSVDDQMIVNALRLFQDENIPLKQSAKIVAKLYNLKRNYVYDFAVKFLNSN